MAETDDKKASCTGDCNRCISGSDQPVDPDAPRGLKLLVPAVTAFTLPLVLAVIGGIVAGGSAGQQWVGAAIGLVGGLLLAVAIGRWSTSAGREKQQA
ncbi:MAG: hypothetical protein ACLFVU_06295 [Phycisphaerae bacterium]